MTATPANPRRSRTASRLGWAVFVSLWFAVLAMALSMCIAGLFYTKAYYDRVDGPLAEFGLRDAVFGTAEIWMLAPMSRAGGLSTLRSADAVIAINGVPAPRGAANEAELVRRLQAATAPVMLRTRSRDGTLRNHRLERTPAHTMAMRARTGLDMWTTRLVEVGLRSLSAVLMISAGIVLFARRTRDPVAALLSIAFCGLAAAMGPTAPAHTFLPWLAPLVAVSGVLASTAMLLAVVLFPNGRLESRLACAVAGGLGIYTAYCCLRIFGLVPPVGTVWADIGLVMASGLVLVLRYRRLPPGPQRQQIRWATLGFALAALVVQPLILLVGRWGQWSDDLTVSVWSGPAAAALSVLLAVVLAGGLLISLLRYRLYDADMVISRSAGYAILTLGLAGVWAGAEKTLEVLFEGQLGRDAGAASAGIAAALAALLVTPAHHRVMHWTEHVFQRALARLRRDLPQTMGDLRETASLKSLLDTVLTEAGVGVRATRAAVVLNGDKGLAPVALRDVSDDEVTAWLRGAGDVPASQDRDDPLFPLRLPLTDTNETFGWLLMGPRPDGSFYGRDELEALHEVAGPVARAVRIVVAREAKENAWQGRLDGFAEELAALRKAVDLPRLRRRPSKA